MRSLPRLGISAVSDLDMELRHLRDADRRIHEALMRLERMHRLRNRLAGAGGNTATMDLTLDLCTASLLAFHAHRDLIMKAIRRLDEFG